MLCIATHHVVGDPRLTMDFAYAYARRFADKPFLSTVPKTWLCGPLKYFDTPSVPVLSPTHGVNPRYHHLSRPASPSLPSPRATFKSTQQPRNSPRSGARSTLPHQLQVSALSRFSPHFCSTHDSCRTVSPAGRQGDQYQVGCQRSRTRSDPCDGPGLLLWKFQASLSHEDGSPMRM